MKQGDILECGGLKFDSCIFIFVVEIDQNDVKVMVRILEWFGHLDSPLPMAHATKS